uniref:Hemocyanin_N domain-containing protein n=1 Tax=Anopheles atroparvus TaxID=41427 RepID=A0A182IM30_ANOAO
MRLTVVAIALGLVALTSAASYPTSQPVTGVKYADKEFLYKQKFFFEVLRNIHLPLQFEEYLPYTKSYVTDESKYTNFQEVVEFFNYYKVGILGKGELFSIYNKEYMKQTPIYK